MSRTVYRLQILLETTNIQERRNQIDMQITEHSWYIRRKSNLSRDSVDQQSSNLTNLILWN